MVAVQIDGLQGPLAASNLQPVGAASHVGTHLPSGVDKANVALNGVGANALNLYAILACGARSDCAKR